MRVITLVALEGKNPLAPNTVLDVEEGAGLTRLLELGAVREATKEDVALAQVKGTYVAPEAPKAQRKAQVEKPAAPKGETKPADEGEL